MSDRELLDEIERRLLYSEERVKELEKRCKAFHDDTIRLQAALDAAQAKVKEYEAEIDGLRMVYRHGTPFDPTGALNATEISSLRTTNARLTAERERLEKALQGCLSVWDEKVKRLASTDPSLAFDYVGDPPRWVTQAREALAAQGEK